ncbi:acetyl-CoA carboxylase biotin carboxyl carrier protein [Nostoc sp. CMAA1605]|uniref:acetyl-CoA carboxylase biotin carboxyl carrier protein n=1 Tax=Nostoc sp. CMAA1605 TaxID=2055159 RepID=UPI001F3F00BB|nr:acetyl-CoA carboxylase biotin carboxyl carrier protein [Nostoc sp. CMAA1605]MCF4968817.1 acetyl-CoA carboxylase biotin carboxyl carrier protein [Nostoc sp. CMAA1605]
MPLDFSEIRQLLETIAQNNISEVTLKSDDFELTVRKTVTVTHPVVSELPTVAAIAQPSLPIVAPEVAHRVADHAVASSGAPSGASSSPIIDQKLVEVPSPMVGTFYRAPAPGEAAFVEVGDRVRKGQTVCIIEAMKLMNEIEAEISGQVVEILIQNGEPVEYNQPLMRINPD